MIHIVKNKNGKFEVIETGKNGQFLSTSLQQFERRAGCWRNVRARMDNFGTGTCRVQDDTAKGGIIIYSVYRSGGLSRLDSAYTVAPFARKKMIQRK